MSWYIFAWVMLPPGFLLAVMLGSSQKHMMQIASIVLSSPVRIWGMTVSLAVFAVALSGTVALLQYSVWSHSEQRLAELDLARKSTIEGTLLYEQQHHNVFRQQRNLYITLLALFLWGFTWRLKVLHSKRQLLPPSRGRGAQSGPTRLFYAIVGIGALLLADVPLCRVEYRFHLGTYVTPAKERLLASPAARTCADATLDSATGQCRQFCLEARKISEARHDAIMSARRWHPMGRLAAQLFDEGRGVEQGSTRLDELFAKKTCEQVVRSADKSNTMVNTFCVGFAGVSIIAGMAALAVVFSDSDDEPSNEHRD